MHVHTMIAWGAARPPAGKLIANHIFVIIDHLLLPDGLKMALCPTACRPFSTCIRTSIGTRISTASIFYLIRCLDEPSACILHQMLAPSHA